MSEKRKHSRKVVNSRVKVFHPDIVSFESKTKDISNGGILISPKQHSKSIQLKDVVKVVFLDSGNVDIIFNMIVIRITKNDLGLQFISCEKKGKVFKVSSLRDVLG